MRAKTVAASRCCLGKTTCSTWHSCDTLRAADFFPQSEPRPDQEVVGQEGHGQVVMPAPPARLRGCEFFDALMFRGAPVVTGSTLRLRRLACLELAIAGRRPGSGSPLALAPPGPLFRPAAQCDPSHHVLGDGHQEHETGCLGQPSHQESMHPRPVPNLGLGAFGRRTPTPRDRLGCVRRHPLPPRVARRRVRRQRLPTRSAVHLRRGIPANGLAPVRWTPDDLG
jgi:hypothetical protein